MIISLVKPYEDIQRDVNILINGRKTNISEDENIKIKYLLQKQYAKSEITIELKECNISYIYAILRNTNDKTIVIIEPETIGELEEIESIIDKKNIRMVVSIKHEEIFYHYIMKSKNVYDIDLDNHILEKYIEDIRDCKNIRQIGISEVDISKINLKMIEELMRINKFLWVNIRWENLIGLHYRNLFNLKDFDIIRSQLLKIKEKIGDKESELYRFLKAYYIVGKNIDYAFNVDGDADRLCKSHSLYGAIVERRAVCEGYAEVLSQLLNFLGVKNKCVTGKSKFEKTARRHVWNQVMIDGKWYNCDITNDAVNIREKRKLESCLIGDQDLILYEAISDNAEKCLETYSARNEKDER